ncbi:MAG: hypothetical protein HY525_15090 [Betaproteobacteria bacterium]|nr:hypothetical protein [Betaproteobacteria bacterium]
MIPRKNRERHKEQLGTLIDRVKTTPRQPGVEEIRIPSERSFRERARLAREGIEIGRRIRDALLRPASGKVGDATA